MLDNVLETLQILIFNFHKESESEVVQLCLTLCNPMDCSLPGFSIHAIFQARILEWVPISFLQYKVSTFISSILHIMKLRQKT